MFFIKMSEKLCLRFLLCLNIIVGDKSLQSICETYCNKTAKTRYSDNFQKFKFFSFSLFCNNLLQIFINSKKQCCKNLRIYYNTERNSVKTKKSFCFTNMVVSLKKITISVSLNSRLHSNFYDLSRKIKS